MNCGTMRVADLVERRGVERRSWLVAAERGRVLRDRQGAMAGDPVAELDVGRRVPEDDDLLRVVDQLVDAEGDGHRDQGSNGPPGRPRRLCAAGGQQALWAAGDPAQPER